MSDLRLFLISYSSGRFAERNAPDVQLLDLVDSSDRHRRVGGQREAVRIGLRVKRAHVFDLAEVDVREDELLGRRVDHGWAVGTGENVHCGLSSGNGIMICYFESDLSISNRLGFV